MQHVPARCRHEAAAESGEVGSHAAYAWEAGTGGRALRPARAAEDRASAQCMRAHVWLPWRNRSGGRSGWPACRYGANPYELLFQGQTVMQWTMLAWCARRVRMGECDAACTCGPGCRAMGGSDATDGVWSCHACLESAPGRQRRGWEKKTQPGLGADAQRGACPGGDKGDKDRPIAACYEADSLSREPCTRRYGMSWYAGRCSRR